MSESTKWSVENSKTGRQRSAVQPRNRQRELQFTLKFRLRDLEQERMDAFKRHQAEHNNQS